jgi:hypothetical protein
MVVETRRSATGSAVLAMGIFVTLPPRRFLKFRRLTSYHTYGGKLSAIVVAVAVIVFFANGPGWPFRIAMPIVILACLEEIAITAALPARRANVSSFWHALQIRREPTQSGTGVPPAY